MGVRDGNRQELSLALHVKARGPRRSIRDAISRIYMCSACLEAMLVKVRISVAATSRRVFCVRGSVHRPTTDPWLEPRWERTMSMASQVSI